jgi:hypothetical protein
MDCLQAPQGHPWVLALYAAWHGRKYHPVNFNLGFFGIFSSSTIQSFKFSFWFRISPLVRVLALHASQFLCIPNIFASSEIQLHIPYPASKQMQEQVNPQLKRFKLHFVQFEHISKQVTDDIAWGVRSFCLIRRL